MESLLDNIDGSLSFLVSFVLRIIEFELSKDSNII